MESYLFDPEFVDKLIASLHMDDLISGSNSLSVAVEFLQKSKQRLSTAGFNLRKFHSNFKHGSILNEHFNSDGYVKVLGLLWDKVKDEFVFSFKHLLKDKVDKPTKRNVIKLLASIYDPLGVLNPIVVTFKVFFQKLCLSKLGWDEHLDGDLLKEWNVIIEGLSDASDICVPRIYADMSRDVDCVELHGFADASVKAYGCCIYMRVKYVDGSVVSCLVCAKSRVAPIKKMAVPRL